MSKISKRLSKFIAHKKMNSSSFSAALGYKSSEKISRLFRDENENANPSAEILQDIANKFADLNIVWLLTGNGEMLLNKTSPTSEDMEDGRTIEVNADKIMSLLIEIRDEQKRFYSNFLSAAEFAPEVDQSRDQNTESLDQAKSPGEKLDDLKLILEGKKKRK